MITFLSETEKHKFTREWWLLLGHHFSSPYMQALYDKIAQWARTGDTIMPSKSDVFIQFKNCDFDNVKVCFILEYPLFKDSLLLEKIHEMIDKECFKNSLYLNLNTDLNYLLEQGIFNVPMIRTCSKDHDHSILNWEKFNVDVLKSFDKTLNKICFVYEPGLDKYLGNIDKTYHTVIKLEPGCFAKINEFMQQEYNLDIKWI